MDFRVRQQFTEAFGQTNRWYCAQAYGQPIQDRELLVVYYIKSGGAEDFARRYEEAMGPLNRWYCSEYYRRDVRDPKTLWDYYMNYFDPGDGHGGMSIAC
jgi:hypothetical protein